MMKNIYILLLALALSGCYEDKGNYDYVKLSDIVIEGIDEKKSYDLYLGEPFTMPEPIIRFTDSTQAHNDLSYRWRLDTNIISTEKKLNVMVALEPNFIGYFGDFTVKDNKTGIAYSQKFRVTVLAAFTNGWMWLTENNGKAELNMMTGNLKYYNNVYSSVNGNELGSKAYGLVEHFDATGSYSGVIVIAGGGNGVGPVELDWSSLRKEVYLSQEFVGEKMPAGLNVVASCFMKNYSCVISDAGKLYVRHAPGGYLYEGRYPAFPFHGDYKLSPKVAYAFPKAYNAVLFFDELRSRYMYLLNGELKGFDELTDEGGAFRVADMNKDLIYISAVSQKTNKNVFYAILQDKTNKKYYTQQFELTINGSVAALKTVRENEFIVQADEHTQYAAGYKMNTVYFSAGSIVYGYNRELNDRPFIVKDFQSGQITALAGNHDGYQLGVTVQNGKTHDFYWIDAEYGSIYKKASDVPGDVKCLIYKAGFSFYY